MYHILYFNHMCCNSFSHIFAALELSCALKYFIFLTQLGYSMVLVLFDIIFWQQVSNLYVTFVRSLSCFIVARDGMQIWYQLLRYGVGYYWWYYHLAYLYQVHPWNKMHWTCWWHRRTWIFPVILLCASFFIPCHYCFWFFLANIFFLFLISLIFVAEIFQWWNFILFLVLLLYSYIPVMIICEWLLSITGLSLSYLLSASRSRLLACRRWDSS